MYSARCEISRTMGDVMRLAARIVPPPNVDLLALPGRALPPPLLARLGELWRRVPPEQLEAVLRLPLVRRALIEAIFWQMPLYFDARRAGGSPMAIRWQLAGREDGLLDVYDVVISEDGARVVRGGGTTPPGLTITADPLELLRIASGRSDPIRAYLAGRLSARGDLLLAARMASIFRFPAGAGGGRPAGARGGRPAGARGGRPSGAGGGRPSAR